MVQERLYSSAIFLGKTICSEHLKKISYFHVFFWERTFIFRTKNKIIFSGRSSIIFLDEKRNIIFQCGIFGKTIFSEHLEKKYGFSCSVGYQS